MARFSVGDCYSSYGQLMKEISGYEEESFVNLAKKHSRTTENAFKMWFK